MMLPHLPQQQGALHPVLNENLKIGEQLLDGTKTVRYVNFDDFSSYISLFLTVEIERNAKSSEKKS